MDLTIILVNYKTEALIINCLRSVFKHTKTIAIEIIVADNAYSKEGEALVKKEFPDIQWIDMGYNAGFARANNAGIDVAKGTFLLLLNADTLLIDNAIEKAIFRLKQDEGIAAIGGIQLYEDLSEMPYYKTINDIRSTFYILPNKPIFYKILAFCLPKPHFTDPNETNSLVGAFVLTRAVTVAKVGKLEEDFFMYGEDVEWAGRLKKAGKLCYFDDIRFIHLVNESPFRRTQISFVNRFSTQMQVSNFLWIRKEFGIGAYLVLILNYLSLIPFFWTWKIFVNLSHFRSPFTELSNQKIFTRKTFVLLKYFWRTIRNNPYFYQIKPSENIDKLYQ